MHPPFIDTYRMVGFAKLYDRKTPVLAAELLNDPVLPFFEQHEIPLNRSSPIAARCTAGHRNAMRTNCTGSVEHIDHTRTKTRHPQTNGICERFHNTRLNEFYRVAFLKKIYRTLEDLQVDLETWVPEYNGQRSHQGRSCYGKTPLHTFIDRVSLAKENRLAAYHG